MLDSSLNWDETSLSDDESSSPQGYSHYNDQYSNCFTISLFDSTYSFQQNPSSKALGIGGCVWDSSVIFSKFVEYNRNSKFSRLNMQDKTCLELGAGCGLAGVSLMLRGCEVSFTDLNIVMDELTRNNVMKIFNNLKSNGNIHSIEFKEPKLFSIDWKNYSLGVEDNSSVLQSSYDIVLFTDCIFSNEMTDYLLKLIGDKTNSKSIILCCHEIRDQVCLIIH